MGDPLYYAKNWPEFWRDLAICGGGDVPQRDNLYDVPSWTKYARYRRR